MRTIYEIAIIILALHVGAIIGQDKLNTAGSIVVDKTITSVKTSCEYVATKWNADKEVK